MWLRHKRGLTLPNFWEMSVEVGKAFDYLLTKEASASSAGALDDKTYQRITELRHEIIRSKGLDPAREQMARLELAQLTGNSE